MTIKSTGTDLAMELALKNQGKQTSAENHEVAADQGSPAATQETSQAQATTQETATEKPVIKEPQANGEATAEKKVETQAATTGTQATEKEKGATKEGEDWFLGEADKPAPDTNTESSSSADPLYSQWKENYSHLAEDPEFKLFVDMKKQGKSLADVASKLSITDYNKLGGVELIESLAKIEGWTDEEKEAELDQFNSIETPRQRKKAEAEFRADLNNRQKSEINKLTYVDPELEKRNAYIQDKAIADLDAVASEMKTGRNFLGYVFNEESDPQSFKDFVMNFDSQFKNQDGTVNMRTMRNMWFGANNLQKLHKILSQTATSAGKDSVLNELSRVSKEEVVTQQRGNSITEAKSGQEKADQLKDWKKSKDFYSSPKPANA